MQSLCNVAESFGNGAAFSAKPVASWPVGVARCPSFQWYTLRSFTESDDALELFFVALARELLTLGALAELLPDVCAAAIWLMPSVLAIANRMRFIVIVLNNRTAVSKQMHCQL